MRSTRTLQGSINAGRRTITLPARAFTLIEVLIVIAILLAIGGLVLVNFMPAKEGADINTQRLQIQQIDAAMDMFKLHMNRYPSDEEGLAALTSKDAITDEQDATKWQGPYLKEPITQDKWGSAFIYRFPGEIRGETYYDLVSAGPDRQEGTADDITNHDHVKDAEGNTAEPGDNFAPPSAPSGGTSGAGGG